MKKKKCVIMAVLLVGIVGIITLILLNFYFTKNKVKEFDYQQCMVDISDEMRTFYTDFDKCCTMDYEEYSAFCRRYDFEQKYYDENKHYVVYAYYFCGMSFFDVKSVYILNDKMIINTKEENWGATGNITSRMIIVPTDGLFADDMIVLNNKYSADKYNFN